jgi:hypothetical protein
MAGVIVFAVGAGIAVAAIAYWALVRRRARRSSGGRRY